MSQLDSQLIIEVRSFCSLIEYSSQDDADNALRKLDGTDLKGAVVTVFEDVRVARFDKICLVGLLITCLVSRSDREVAEVVVVVTALDHPVTATAVTAVIVTVTVNATVTAEADTTVNADAVPRPATTASATVIAAMIARTATDPVTDPGSGLCAVRSVINYINSTAYASACRFMSNIPQMDGMLRLSNQAFFSCSLELWRMTSPDTDNRRTRENLTLESISPILPCKPIKASSSRSRLAASSSKVVVLSFGARVCDF